MITDQLVAKPVTELHAAMAGEIQELHAAFPIDQVPE